MNEHKTYRAVTHGNFQLDLPEFNWGVSVSVDTFAFEDKQPYRVYWQTEPPEIIDNQEKLIRNHGFYDLILTWDQRVLSECKNARLFHPGAVWAQEPDTSQKKFQVSFLTSSKNSCYGHKFRHDTFNVLPASIEEAIKFRGGGNADQAIGEYPFLRNLPITKHMSPPYLPNKRDLLVPFQYTIVMENAQHNNFFTEKILDAFATKTLPLYWGSPNIGDFFNPKGILAWAGIPNLFDRLNNLQPGYYESLTDVIEENYQLAIKYADRTGNIAKAIIDSWTPKFEKIHGGQPNVPPAD